MCLYATTKEALIAEEDIEVYKVVEVKNGRYYSPYMNSPLKEQAACEDTILPTGVFCSTPLCTSQGIHALRFVSSAYKLMMNCQLCNWEASYKIIKGTIPKGTPYWLDYNEEDIAAKYIKFDRSEERI